MRVPEPAEIMAAGDLQEAKTRFRFVRRWNAAVRTAESLRALGHTAEVMLSGGAPSPLQQDDLAWYETTFSSGAPHDPATRDYVYHVAHYTHAGFRAYRERTQTATGDANPLPAASYQAQIDFHRAAARVKYFEQPEPSDDDPYVLDDATRERLYTTAAKKPMFNAGGLVTLARPCIAAGREFVCLRPNVDDLTPELGRFLATHLDWLLIGTNLQFIDPMSDQALPWPHFTRDSPQTAGMYAKRDMSRPWDEYFLDPRPSLAFAEGRIVPDNPSSSEQGLSGHARGYCPAATLRRWYDVDALPAECVIPIKRAEALAAVRLGLPYEERPYVSIGTSLTRMVLPVMRQTVLAPPSPTQSEPSPMYRYYRRIR